MNQGPLTSPEAKGRAQLVPTLLNREFPSPCTSEKIHVLSDWNCPLSMSYSGKADGTCQNHAWEPPDR